ncbi:5312_t:CDS:2 [Entrophospora sp. SA101]|nr:5312_t:CDS:2 [Entrophospora sp. SA101]
MVPSEATDTLGNPSETSTHLPLLILLPIQLKNPQPASYNIQQNQKLTENKPRLRKMDGKRNGYLPSITIPCKNVILIIIAQIVPSTPTPTPTFTAESTASSQCQL